MPAEAPFSVTAKGPRGELFTLRGDNYDEFATNAERALGQEGSAKLLAGYTAAFGGSTEQVAVQNLAPVAQTVTYQSTVGQPLPQPGQQQAPVSAPQGNAGASSDVPPGVTYPGDCQHGRRPYKDTNTSRGQWRRFECALPWSKDAAASRCRPVNL